MTTPENPQPADRAVEDSVRTKLLDALDFSYCQGLGYSAPEELLAAYDRERATVQPFCELPHETIAEEDACDRRRLEADRAAVLREAADAIEAEQSREEAEEQAQHGSLDHETVLQGAAVRDKAALLRRMADETAATETPGKSCAHCGQPVSRVIGTLTAWWVHAPGGNTVCDPQQAASSPRATPKVADTPFVPPAHYRGRDGTWYCAHATPVGPDSCRECRELHAAAQPAGGESTPAAAMLATPCDACDHTLNWHRNDVGCTVPRCVCGHFQQPAGGQQ
jgi:hypothetical protein